MAILTSEYQYIGRSNAVSSPSGYSYYMLLYAKTAGDVATGKHAVSVKMRLVCNSATFYGWSTSGSASVAGVSAFSWSWANVPGSAWNSTAITEDGVTYSNWADLKEGTVELDVGHGETRDITISGSWVMNSTNSASWFPQTGVYAKVSVLVTLPMIAGATAPAPGAAEAVLGKAVTISTPAVADGFTHTLTWSFGSLSGTIAEHVTDSCTWTPPLSLAAQIPNTDSGTAIITCATYSGSTQIGSNQTATILLRVPEDVIPTVSATWEDTSGAQGKVGILVQNISALAVTVAGTGIHGSTVRSAAVLLDGAAYSGAVIRSSGDLTLRVCVTDSRGRTGSRDYTLTLAPYTVPQLTLAASRCDEDGNADEMGEYARITVTGSITELSGGNTAALSLTYGSTTVSVEDDSYSAIVEAPSVSTMKISATLTDNLAAVTRSMVLSVGYATMDFLAGGRGIAFGASATREGFDCAMPAWFSQGLNDLRLQLLRFDTNTTVEIPITGRTPVFIVLMGNDGNCGVFLAGCRNTTELSSFTRIVGELAVTAKMADGILTLTCPVNWSYGWYMARV